MLDINLETLLDNWVTEEPLQLVTLKIAKENYGNSNLKVLEKLHILDLLMEEQYSGAVSGSS